MSDRILFGCLFLIASLSPSHGAAGQSTFQTPPALPNWAVNGGQCDWAVIQLVWEGKGHTPPPDSGCLGAALATASTRAGGMQIWGSGAAANGCPFPFNPTVSNTSASLGRGHYKIELTHAEVGCLPRYDADWLPQASLFAHLIDAPGTVLAAGRMKGKVKVIPIINTGPEIILVSVESAAGVGRDSGATGQVTWSLGAQESPITFSPSSGEGSSLDILADDDSGQVNMDASLIVAFSAADRIDVSAKRGGILRARIDGSKPELRIAGICKNVITGDECTGSVLFLYGWSGD